MDPRSWPLSVAATRRLLDLRPDRPAVSSESQLVSLSAKELIMRGGLRIDRAVKKRRTTQLIVTTHPPTHPLPGAAALLAERIGPARTQELGSLIKATVRKHRRLGTEVRAETGRELAALGLTVEQRRKMLGLFPQRYLALTPSGEAWQRSAAATLERGEQLAARAAAGPIPPAEIDALGPLLVLVPGGLAMGARTSAHLRASAGPEARRRRPGSDTADASLRDTSIFAVMAGSDDPQIHRGSDGPDTTFSALDGLGDSLDGFFDDALGGLDSAFDAFDSSFDSAFDSIDSAFDSIDSAVDGGFSDGGGGDGGGGGGGGD